MSLYNLIQLVTTIFAYSVIGFYLYLLTLGVFRFVLRDYLGLFHGRDHSLHCSTRFSLSRPKAVFSRLGGGSCNSMPKVKTRASKNFLASLGRGRALPEGEPLPSAAKVQFALGAKTNICPKQHGLRIHTQHALSLRRC